MKRARCQEKNDGNMKKIIQFDKMTFYEGIRCEFFLNPSSAFVTWQHYV